MTPDQQNEVSVAVSRVQIAVLNVTLEVMPKDQSQPSDSAENAYDRNGVDLTLIRWMLTLTPVERIEHIQQAADSLEELRSLNGIAEPG